MRGIPKYQVSKLTDDELRGLPLAVIKQLSRANAIRALRLQPRIAFNPKRGWGE